MKKHSLIRLIAYPTTLALLLMASSFYQAQQKNYLELTLKHSYQNGIYGLASSIDEIKNELERSLVLTQPKGLALSASKIMVFAAQAKGALNSFPIYGENTDIMSLYLAQVGEYCFYLSEKAIMGGTLTDEERDSLGKILLHTESISAKLEETKRLTMNGLFYFPLTSSATEKNARAGSTERPPYLTALENERAYPQLYYDGAFSDHKQIKMEYAALHGKDELDEAQITQRAASFLGTTPENLKAVGKSESTPTLHTFGAADMSIDIFSTGDVLSIVNGRERSEPTISEEDAILKAEGFLKMNGINDMQLVNHRAENGALICTFAYLDGDTVYYTDKLIVVVGLDKGDILSYYALDYLKNHTISRVLPKKRISLDKAEGHLPSGHSLSGTRYAVIASPGGFEQHSIELSTNKDERNYLYYIDAQDGSELALILN